VGLVSGVVFQQNREDGASGPVSGVVFQQNREDGASGPVPCDVLRSRPPGRWVRGLSPQNAIEGQTARSYDSTRR
jgi:hypothetical protein